MRTRPYCTRAFAALVHAAAALAAGAAPPPSPARPDPDPPAARGLHSRAAQQLAAGDPTALRLTLAELDRLDPRAAEDLLAQARARWPEDDGLQLAYFDSALRAQRAAAVLQEWQRLPEARRERPALLFRAAQAYDLRGDAFGGTELRSVPGGAAGQFSGDWLLIEERGPDRFLCCPRASALYTLRLALDAGFDEPAAHLLHARLWQRLERPDVALQILEAHAARLLAAQPPLDCQGLQMLAELSLQRGALQPYLHYTRRLAELRPEQRDTVLLEACAQVAGFYGERGDVDRHLDWLTRAVRRAPRDAAVLLRLADAEWTSGRTCAAVEHYRTVLELEPEHAARPRIAARLADFPHPAAPVP